MTWKTHIGRLASEAQALAQTAIAQGVPVAKQVATHVRTAASAVVDEVMKASAEARPTVRKAHAPASSITTSNEPPAKDSIAVRTQNRATIDLTGLSITADDALELRRRPSGLEQTAFDAVVGNLEPSAEQAEEVRSYIVSTPATIFEASVRIAASATDLRARGELDGEHSVWQGVRDSTAVLQAYDRANGTDLAASSWLAMMGSWQKSAIASANTDAAGAAAMAIHLASESARAHHHASEVCSRLLDMAHVTGWPSILFDDAGGIAKLAALLRSAVPHPDLHERVRQSAFGLAGAMLITPITPAEAALARMNPSALRAELGAQICDVLDQLGHTTHGPLRAAVEALAASAEANPSGDELRELDRLPRWLVSHELAFGNDAARYARHTMAASEARELAGYVAGTRGDIGAMEKRLRGLWVVPRVCADLAERYGVDAKPPINGLQHGGFISDGVEIAQNLERAFRMLASFDAEHGTRHGLDAATALLNQTHLGPRHRELVSALRDSFGSPTATADDKARFFGHITRLLEADAWPALATRDLDSMRTLIGGLTDLAKASPERASQIFVDGFKIVSTAVRTPQADVDDAPGRAAMASMIAELADAIGRPSDAAIYRALSERLSAP